MRIISKFHDYYDVVMKQGMDKEVVYVRETKEIRIFDKYNKNIVSPENKLVEVVRRIPVQSGVHDGLETYSIEYNMVGVAGKWYMIGHLHVSGEGILCVHEVFCNEDEFVDLLTRYNSKKMWQMYEGKSIYGASCWDSLDNDKRGLREVFGLGNSVGNELFLKYNTPVIVLQREWIERRGFVWTMKTDGCLKDTGIVKILDPFTCYQEIYMYMGGVLRKKENDTVVISDNDMRDKQGFDKWSFRKMSVEKGV